MSQAKTAPANLALVVTFLSALLLAVSCGQDNSTTTEQSEQSAGDNGMLPATSLTNLHINAYNSGIEFFAIGSDPEFELDLDVQGLLSVHTGSGTILELAMADINTITYNEKMQLRGVEVVQDEQLIKIVLNRGTCRISNKTFPFTYAVQITVQEGEDDQVLYSGCGAFTIDPRLHNIWVIESIDDVALNADNYEKGLPTLEFNIGTGMMLGHDGCNNINGAFQVEEGQITFGPMPGTLMACPNAQLSSQVGRVLSEKTYQYFIDDRLELLSNRKIRMSLRAVD